MKERYSPVVPSYSLCLLFPLLVTGCGWKPSPRLATGHVQWPTRTERSTHATGLRATGVRATGRSQRWGLWPTTGTALWRASPRDAARHATAQRPQVPHPRLRREPTPMSQLSSGGTFSSRRNRSQRHEGRRRSGGRHPQRGGRAHARVHFATGPLLHRTWSGPPAHHRARPQVAPKPLIAGAPVLIPPVTNQTTGAAASISPVKLLCEPTFLPVAVIITVKATKGSGPAGAQVYSRPEADAHVRQAMFSLEPERGARPRWPPWPEERRLRILARDYPYLLRELAPSARSPVCSR